MTFREIYLSERLEGRRAPPKCVNTDTPRGAASGNKAFPLQSFLRDLTGLPATLANAYLKQGEEHAEPQEEKQGEVTFKGQKVI